MTRKEKIIYLAGIVDGEGHMRVSPIKRGDNVWMRPDIFVAQKNKEGLLEWLKENFGGWIGTGKPIWRLGAMRQWHTWDISGSKAVDLAKEIEPYLIVKQEQVKRLTRIRYTKKGKLTVMIKETAYN